MEKESRSFVVGQLVRVDPRTGPGMNQPGGIGRIVRIVEQHRNNDNESAVVPQQRFYSVKYVLDSRTEHHLSEEYIHEHEFASTKFRDRRSQLGRCRRCGSLRKDCGNCENEMEDSVTATTPTTRPDRESITTKRPFDKTENYIDEDDDSLDDLSIRFRKAAKNLSTPEQALRESQAPSKLKEPYTPTHADYLAFLVDSQHVYQAFEDIVNSRDELACFRNTGLERVIPLEKDIEFMCQHYNLHRPAVGSPGRSYAETLRGIQSVPEFICHFYNVYFAHTEGGRVIGKQLSKLLLDSKTLEFYKWDGDLNQIKANVKNDIETMAANWSLEERNECVDATAAAFEGGGAIITYLTGGTSPLKQGEC